MKQSDFHPEWEQQRPVEGSSEAGTTLCELTNRRTMVDTADLSAQQACEHI